MALTSARSAATRHICTYTPNLVDERRGQIREFWGQQLIVLGGHYGIARTIDAYIQDILALKEIMNEQFPNDFNHPRFDHDPGFRISHAQKSLAVYLKHMWCMGMIAEPPACPIDRRILCIAGERINLAWGHINDIDAYRGQLRILQQAAEDANRSLACWELLNW